MRSNGGILLRNRGDMHVGGLVEVGNVIPKFGYDIGVGKSYTLITMREESERKDIYRAMVRRLRSSIQKGILLRMTRDPGYTFPLYSNTEEPHGETFQLLIQKRENGS